MVHWGWLIGAWLAGLATAWIIGMTIYVKQSQSDELTDIEVAIVEGQVYFYRGQDLMMANLSDPDTVDVKSIVKVDLDTIGVHEMTRVSQAIEILNAR